MGALELQARKMLDAGQENEALRIIKSTQYISLCMAQLEPQSQDFYYRTAEDTRVLALKIRHQVPVSDRALIGSGLTNLRGAFDYISTVETDKLKIFSELASAYLIFCSATKVPQAAGMKALEDICEQAGTKDLLDSFRESMPQVK